MGLNDFRQCARSTIDVLKRGLEFERTLYFPNFERNRLKLQGVALLLSGIDGVDDLKAEIESLVVEYSDTPTIGERGDLS